MNMNYYQELAVETSVYDRDLAVIYPAMGLAGEVGEVLNKIKKVYRDDGGEMTFEQREGIAKELGDVMWYLANLASDLNVTLAECASGNLSKLASRKSRGVLGGSGDDR